MMSRKVTTEVILKEFAKQSLDYLNFKHNRCSQCGRRLKLMPGAILQGGYLLNERFRTCRSCGFENPTLSMKVAESLESQGYELVNFEAESPLPQCLNCGKELQITRDFTKIFCCKCGGAWDRFTIEEIFGYPLSPQLAGRIPIAPDDSKHARELEHLISLSEIDSGTAYKVIRVIPSHGENQADVSPWSSFASEVKDGLIEQWTMPIKFVKRVARKEAIEDVSKKSEIEYLAIYEDYIAHYKWKEEKLKVSEVQYADIFSDSEAPLTIPFPVATESQKEYREFMEFWAQFWVIYRSNLEPFKAVLFGEKARAESERLAKEVAPTMQGQGNLASEIEKLANLHAKGLLTDDEFKQAKSRLLS